MEKEDFFFEAVVLEEEEEEVNMEINAINIQCRYCKILATKKLTVRPSKGINKSMPILPRKLKRKVSDGVCFVDSGCSNHMSGTKSLYKEPNESHKSEV